MPKYKVVGVSESKGEYKGYEYRNLILHTECEDRYTVGVKTDKFKIKWVNLSDVFRLGLRDSEINNLTTSDFKDLLGKNVFFSFDRYGNPDRVEVIEEKAKTQ